jgi:hypothetical protein
MEKNLAYWQDKAATLSIEGRAFIATQRTGAPSIA